MSNKPIINPLTGRKIKPNSKSHKLLWSGSQYDHIRKPTNVKIPKRLQKKKAPVKKKANKKSKSGYKKFTKKELDNMSIVSLYKEAGGKRKTVPKGLTRTKLINLIRMYEKGLK
jgi:hypothetical protein